MTNSFSIGVFIIFLIIGLAAGRDGFIVVTVLLISGLLLNAMFAGSGPNADDTDLRKDGKVVERSGMMIITDHGTGVQYVAMPLVGMTVRVDRDGKPMVEAKP